VIYRIAESADWNRANERGGFASADLAAEGFIHISELHQVLRTANKYYRGKTRLVLLEIDESLLDVPVIREDLNGSGVIFPHSYAAIPLRAIVRNFDLTMNANGDFQLPDGLIP
jgi:uncharacterized protein (DUF952 family)